MDQPIEDLTKTSKPRVTFDPTLYQSGDDEDQSIAQKQSQQHDEVENEEMEDQSKVIAPNVTGKGGRNLALMDEIKQREASKNKVDDDSTRVRIFGSNKVDKDCEIKNVQVLEDYSCHLQHNDISYNDDQQTRFYTMQLLERNDGKKWFVWTKHGKLAQENFNTKVKEYFNKFDAMVEFESRFSQKTANKWADRAYFQQKPGLYMMIRKDSENETVNKFCELEKEILALISDGNKRSNATKISSPEVGIVVQRAWDISAMKKVLADLNIDVERLPLGKLQRDHITKCYKILLQIQKILLSGDKNKEKFISSLSNDFYSIIPHNYGIKKPVNIDHLLRIKDKIKVLETVSAIQASQSLLVNQEAELRIYNPMDIQYGLLSCKVELIDQTHRVYELIQQAVQNTHADSHSQVEVEVLNIFTLEKASEKLRFMPFDKSLHNKFLLWHGVQQTSLASTLREGLQLPSAEIPAATFRYGKGIYFTDCCSKAITQSVNPARGTSGEGYVLLCEVAMGDMQKVYQPIQLTKPQSYSHSVYGVGQLKPKLVGIKDMNRGLKEGNFLPSEMTICSPDALFFNTGKLGPNQDLNEATNAIEAKFNEFVVYDEAQVRLRYLVNFSFKVAAAGGN